MTNGSNNRRKKKYLKKMVMRYYFRFVRRVNGLPTAMTIFLPSRRS